MITLKRKLISWKLISYDLLELLPFPLLISSSVWPLVSKISIKHYKESKHQLIPSRMSASLPGLPLFCPTGDFKPAEEILGWCLNWTPTEESQEAKAGFSSSSGKCCTIDFTKKSFLSCKKKEKKKRKELMMWYGLIARMTWRAWQPLKNISDLQILLEEGGISCVIILAREGLGAEIEGFQF